MGIEKKQINRKQSVEKVLKDLNTSYLYDKKEELFKASKLIGNCILKIKNQN